MATDARRLSRNRAVAMAIAMVIAMAKAVVETAEPYGRLQVVRYPDSSDVWVRSISKNISSNNIIHRVYIWFLVYGIIITD